MQQQTMFQDDILTLCLDKFWSKFAERLDGELEKRIQSVMEQQQQRQEEQRRITTRSTTTATVVPPSPPEQSRLLEPEAQHNVMARLHELEIATSRLDYRLAMLEKMIPKPSPKVSEDLRKENFELRAKLADREQKARQLEQEHIEFFKRQTQNMIQMDQMRQKIAALEAELQKQQKHKVPRPQHQQHQQQQHQQQHHPWRKKSSIPPPPPANRLPTPRSSPSHSLQDDEEEDLSVREIDGYLVFNTHIDGELIHCRVKIPNTTASSTPITTSTISMQQRQQQYHHQQQQQQPNRRAMVPPLNNHNMRKKGLNPHAPEWKLSGK